MPLLIDVRFLATRASVEVCDKLGKMVAYLESLQTEGLPIGETCRVKRIHSDRVGDFTASSFARFLQNLALIHRQMGLQSEVRPVANGVHPR